MAKTIASAPTRIKIGGVEMMLRPQPQRGTIPESRLRRAVQKAVASEQPARKN